MASSATNMFDLFGDVKINTDKATKGLTQLSNLMDNIVKKLNTFEKSTVGSKISRAVALQNKGLPTPNRKINQQEYKDIKNRVAHEFQMHREYTASVRKQAAEEKRVTREKEKQLKLLKRQKMAQQGILDKVFSIKNALILMSASYMARMIGDSITLANRLQAVEVKFETIAGNARDAKSEMDWIWKRAKDLRVPVLEATEGFVQFYAAASQSGMASDEMRSIYDSVLQTATVMHLSSDRFKLMSMAIEQMVNKGTVSMEELRRQLGEHVPGAFGIAAKAMGMSGAELNKLISGGQLATDVFLKKFAPALVKAFGSGIPKAMESTQGKINALKNTWKDLQIAFMNGGFIEALGNMADSLRMMIESKEFMDAFVAMGETAKLLSKLGPIIKPLLEILLVVFGSHYIGKFIKFIKGSSFKAIFSLAKLMRGIFVDIILRAIPKLIHLISVAATEWDWLMLYIKNEGLKGLFQYIRDNLRTIVDEFLDMLPGGSGRFVSKAIDIASAPRPSFLEGVKRSLKNWNKSSKDVDIERINAIFGKNSYYNQATRSMPLNSATNSSTTNNIKNDVKINLTTNQVQVAEKAIEKAYKSIYATGGK